MTQCISVERRYKIASFTLEEELTLHSNQDIYKDNAHLQTLNTKGPFKVVSQEGLKSIFFPKLTVS